jgi:hypothetical protein
MNLSSVSGINHQPVIPGKVAAQTEKPAASGETGTVRDNFERKGILETFFDPRRIGDGIGRVVGPVKVHENSVRKRSE